MKSIKYRKYQSGDEGKIIPLYEKTFGHPMGKTESIQHWTWEFIENPNRKLWIWLADDKGEVIGQYTVIPVRFKVASENLMGSLSLDTITDARYRGQGIFPKLAIAMYQQLEKEEIPFTYGFPNKNSIHGFVKKLQWEEVAPLPALILPLRPTRLLKRYLGKWAKALSLLDKVYTAIIKAVFPRTDAQVQSLDKFDHRFDVFWQRIEGRLKTAVIRDEAYLNWRFHDRPESDYMIYAQIDQDEVQGYIVLKTVEQFDLKIGYIMDLMAMWDKPHVIKGLVKKALEVFITKNVDMISILMFNHCYYYRFLRRYFFLKVPRFLFPQEIYFGVRVHIHDFNGSCLTDSRNWYLSWSDTDLL